MNLLPKTAPTTAPPAAPPAAQPAARLRQLLVLLLLALGLLAGVSVSQTRQIEADALHTAAVVLPAIKQVHALAAQVDALRGMAALHLTLRSDTERTELEGRLQATRLQLDRRLAAFGQQLTGAADRRHHQAVAASLAAFWAAHEPLLATSRRSQAEPAAAAQARALLAGEAQAAFERLRAAIDAWWAHTEAQADAAASQARSTAHVATLVVWAQGVLAALALAVAWALQRLPLRPWGLAAAGGQQAGAALDSSAARAHLQALNAAVAAARRGEPGRAAGLSATEAQHLAEQVDSAAQGLRTLIERPRAGVADLPAQRPPA